MYMYKESGLFCSELFLYNSLVTFNFIYIVPLLKKTSIVFDGTNLRSSITHSTLPWLQASWSGVQPTLSVALTSIPVNKNRHHYRTQYINEKSVSTAKLEREYTVKICLLELERDLKFWVVWVIGEKVKFSRNYIFYLSHHQCCTISRKWYFKINMW